MAHGRTPERVRLAKTEPGSRTSASTGSIGGPATGIHPRPRQDHLGQREAGLQAGSLSAGALDSKRAGECLDAVCEASEAVALGVGSADSVVAYLDEEGLAVGRRADLDSLGSGCLCTLVSASAMT